MSEFVKFTKKLLVADVTDEPETYTLETTEADLITLADYLKVPGVEHARGEARVWRQGTIFNVEGRVVADLIRECVASLEEMEEHIEETFHVTYTNDPPAEDLPEEAEADLEGPEYLETPTIDLSEVMVEQIVLAMSAHPRKEGAEAESNPGPGERISPFDVLKKMKGDDDEA